MGGKAARRKGNRGEYELRDILQEHGIPCIRVPLSGAAADFPGDLVVGPPDEQEIWEVKRRAHGWVRLFKWLEDASVVACRPDGKEWIVAMRLEDYLDARRDADACQT